MSFPVSQNMNPRADGRIPPLGGLPGGARLKDVYDGYFQTGLAETEEERRSVFRLRYEVYCVEHPYEDPSQNPNGMESDTYDDSSLHALLTHRPSGSLVGTARLIIPRPGCTLPIRDVCHHELIVVDNPALPRGRTAEISRFAISKNLRRRASDQAKEDTTSVGSFSMGEDPKRIIPNASLGLMQAIVSMAAKTGVTHLCCVMEPTLLRMLRKLGICFEPLGPQVDYHGRRQPCYSFLDAQLARIWLDRPDVWELVTDDGNLWPLNTDLVKSLRSASAVS